MKLINVTEPEAVFGLIAENFSALEAEEVDIEKAGGRCLAEDYFSGEDLPGFDRSTVDGYALQARDTFGSREGLPSVLDLEGEVLMGAAARKINAGQCCLIHTGGMLPAGADAVVMVEDTETASDTVHVYRQVAPGENVIHRGEDLGRGERALAAGSRLRSAEIGLLASMGATRVKVHRRPVMGLLSTGDELVPHDSRNLEPGRVRDCNTPALAYLGQKGGAEIASEGILPDIFDQFLEKSRNLLARVDFLVLSGGSSVGSRDFTARTLQKLGRPGLLVEGISIKPGKPTLLANCGGKPVLGLPGHPISALNVFLIFGMAILDRLSGRQRHRRFFPTVNAILTRNLPSRSGQTDFARVRIERENGQVLAVPVFGRSGMLRTMAEADGFIIVKPEMEGLEAGTEVQVFLWE